MMLLGSGLNGLAGLGKQWQWKLPWPAVAGLGGIRWGLCIMARKTGGCFAAGGCWRMHMGLCFLCINPLSSPPTPKHCIWISFRFLIIIVTHHSCKHLDSSQYLQNITTR